MWEGTKKKYFVAEIFMSEYFIFIVKTPYAQLSNTLVMTNIVPLDKRTMLVDTKNSKIQYDTNW